MEITLNAKCGNCGFIQVLKGFEDILQFNKNKKMGILYDNFLLVHKCKNCKSDYCCKCNYCNCYNDIECSYCGDVPEYKESIYKCDNCEKMFCADHHSDFGICVNCADPKEFRESMENR